jgi:hypothetical protein
VTRGAAPAAPRGPEAAPPAERVEGRTHASDAASWPQAAAISRPRVSRTVQATPGGLHAAHELVLHRPRGGVPLAARRRVERDEVDVHAVPADPLREELPEQVGPPRVVVDVADQRVLDGDARPVAIA